MLFDTSTFQRKKIWLTDNDKLIVSIYYQSLPSTAGLWFDEKAILLIRFLYASAHIINPK